MFAAVHEFANDFSILRATELMVGRGHYFDDDHVFISVICCCTCEADRVGRAEINEVTLRFPTTAPIAW